MGPCLGRRSKPANEGHLKTGQRRSVRTLTTAEVYPPRCEQCLELSGASRNGAILGGESGTNGAD